MSVLYSDLDACVLCSSEQLRCAVPLAPMPIVTPNFKLPAAVSSDEAAAGVPLDLYQCSDCGHVQVGVVGNPELQYRDYVYRTSFSVGLADHFARYAREVVGGLGLVDGSLVVEIGSNDGTLLSGFKAAGMRVRGVDPARAIAQGASERGIPTIGEYFDFDIAQRIRAEAGPAKLIVANNVIANIELLDSFARGVEVLLDRDGVFVFETQYGGDVVERTLLDTVYHEHISYFLTKPTARWLAHFGLELIDVVPIDTKGGSFRGFAQKAGGPRAMSVAVRDWIEREERTGMFAQPFFNQLTERVAQITGGLHEMIDAEHAQGRRVAGFGVSVGTSTLIAQFELAEKIDFLIDDDPDKEHVLAGPNYRLPVISGSELTIDSARMVVVFAWRYIQPIRRRHAAYLNAGGTFVLPLPRMHVVRSIEPVAAGFSVGD